MLDRIAIAGSAFALLGCATAAAQSPYPDRSGAEQFLCRGTGLAQFRGKTPDAGTAQQMLAVSGARIIRWAPHGGAVTMDLREDRLTVWLDAAGKIDRATCG